MGWDLFQSIYSVNVESSTGLEMAFVSLLKRSADGSGFLTKVRVISAGAHKTCNFIDPQVVGDESQQHQDLGSTFMYQDSDETTVFGFGDETKVVLLLMRKYLISLRVGEEEFVPSDVGILVQKCEEPISSDDDVISISVVLGEHNLFVLLPELQRWLTLVIEAVVYLCKREFELCIRQLNDDSPEKVLGMFLAIVVPGKWMLLDINWNAHWSDNWNTVYESSTDYNIDGNPHRGCIWLMKVANKGNRTLGQVYAEFSICYRLINGTCSFEEACWKRNLQHTQTLKICRIVFEIVGVDFYPNTMKYNTLVLENMVSNVLVEDVVPGTFLQKLMGRFVQMWGFVNYRHLQMSNRNDEVTGLATNDLTSALWRAKLVFSAYFVGVGYAVGELATIVCIVLSITDINMETGYRMAVEIKSHESKRALFREDRIDQLLEVGSSVMATRRKSFDVFGIEVQVYCTLLDDYWSSLCYDLESFGLWDIDAGIDLVRNLGYAAKWCGSSGLEHDRTKACGQSAGYGEVLPGEADARPMPIMKLMQTCC